MTERTVYLGTDPVAAYRLAREGSWPIDAGPQLRVSARRTGLPDRAAVGLLVDEAALHETDRGGVWLVDRDQVSIGRTFQPWHVDVEPDSGRRWKGYLDTEYDLTLLNLVDAITPGQLERRETPLVEARIAQLAESPLAATFDLAHLQNIHRQLFQDVYPWAGEVRTVNIGKVGGGPSFMPWDAIEDSGQILAGFVQRNSRLKDLGRREFVEGAAEVYTAVNTLHPFREGNGRTQREWMNALARQAGYQFDWAAVRGHANDRASQAAREDNMAPLLELLEQITHELDLTPTAATAASRAEQARARLRSAEQHLDVARDGLHQAAPEPREPQDPSRGRSPGLDR